MASAVWAQQVHALVDNIFGMSKPEARKMAQKKLMSGVITEVYSGWDGRMVQIRDPSVGPVTSEEVNEVFQEKVKVLSPEGPLAGLPRPVTSEEVNEVFQEKVKVLSP